MTAEQLATILHQTDIFSLVSIDMLMEIIPELTIHTFKKDDSIITKGESGDKMFVLVSGSAKIHDRDHVLATVESGTYFGEFFLFDSAPRSMSVSALNEVEVVGISKDVFVKLLKHHPEIYNKIISLLIKRLREQNNNTISILKSREQELLRLVDERTLELNNKSKELEIKNREITDSIVYAQRIQSAILPETKKIAETFKDSFILFLPKDIVSGDFYAFFLKDDYSIIVAADCTGHGVAGAFMSMIGSSLLNRIIIEKGITKPAIILDQLHKAVIESLRQTENESNDGMDVSICCFDFIQNKLAYAGANRPLWLIRDNELEVIKPDKFPIGGTQISRQNDYTNHILELNANDSIYIFTDGFADQFGGINFKKLMTGKLKELLLSIQNLTMPEQKNFLQNSFNNWKGINEQVDDVLVIGIKV